MKVLQLANISGPAVLLDRPHYLTRDLRCRLSLTPCKYTKEVIDKQRNISAPLAQGRERDRKPVQAIVQIRSELSFSYHFL